MISSPGSPFLKPPNHYILTNVLFYTLFLLKYTLSKIIPQSLLVHLLDYNREDMSLAITRYPSLPEDKTFTSSSLSIYLTTSAIIAYLIKNRYNFSLFKIHFYIINTIPSCLVLRSLKSAIGSSTFAIF